MPPFQLDSRLAADTVEMGRLGPCRVLLMQDARFPWIILVPEKPDLIELTDLTPEEEQAVWTAVRQVSTAMQAAFSPIKMNVAALGNMVRQLHIHIIARQSDDEAWPNPIWGRGTPKAYGDKGAARIATLRRLLPELQG